MKYSFKNKGAEYTIREDWCGGGKHMAIHYTRLMDELVSAEFIVEEEVQGKLFKRKTEKYFIELKYKQSIFGDEVKVKRIYIETEEKQQAIEACAFLKKKMSEVEAEKEEEKRKEEEKKRNSYPERLKEYNRQRIERIAAKLKTLDKSKIVCFDTETTGVEPAVKDEILQLSIIDGNGNVLFNEYVKPQKRVRWPKAEEKNGISPAMVKDKPTIDTYIERLNDIFAGAELIVGYNTGFDIGFIESAGITVPEKAEICDVMETFAPIYGEWSDYRYEYKWQNLATCAYCYEYRFKPHDSLEDAKATLHCFYAIHNGVQSPYLGEGIYCKPKC